MARESKDEKAEREAKADRLVEARKAADFSGAPSTAKRFGWEENTYKAHESGRNGFGIADGRKYAKAFGVELCWLMLGQGPMYEEPRLTVVPVGQEFAPDPDPDEQATIGSETGIRGIPKGTSAQIDVTAGLGAGGLTVIKDGVPGKNGMEFAAEHINDYWRLPGPVYSAMGAKPQDVAIIPVQGDSMANTLVEGDCVLIDTRHRLPSPDGLYALGDEFGGIIVKRLEMASDPGEGDPVVRVISDNIKHAPKEWRLSDMRIIGRVLRKFGVVG